MIEISLDEFRVYIVECENFYPSKESDILDMYYREADDELVAIKDSGGRCFTKTMYWSVGSEPKDRWSTKHGEQK